MQKPRGERLGAHVGVRVVHAAVELALHRYAQSLPRILVLSIRVLCPVLVEPECIRTGTAATGRKLADWHALFLPIDDGRKAQSISSTPAP
jgi:hypothetical protein